MFHHFHPFAGIGLMFILPAIFLYFLPSILASTRRHPNFAGVLLVNLFFGWTFLGWIGALVWALTAPPAGAPSHPLPPAPPSPPPPPPAAGPAGTFCAECGARTGPSDSFCSSCGRKLR